MGSSEDKWDESLLGAFSDAGEKLARELRPLIDGIGDYQVEGYLGRAGRGRIYRGRTPSGELVSIKVLYCPPQHERARQSLTRLVEAAREVQHPNLATTLECVEGESWVAVVREYVGGHGADHRLDPLEPGQRLPRALELGERVAAALQACHDQELVHRDVKPANILIEEDSSRPVLVDLGLTLERRRESESANRRPTGTVGYMAPEQYMPGSTVDERCDVFGLGVTLHRLITGELLTADVAGRSDRLETELAPIAAKARINAQRLAALIAGATHFSAADRFASASRFAAEIHAVAHGTPAPVNTHSAPQGSWRAVAVGGVFFLLLLLGGLYLRGCSLFGTSVLR